MVSRDDVIELAKAIEGATFDCPFEGDFETTALRRKDNRKWFGLLFSVKKSCLGLTGEGEEFILNLKCEIDLSYLLRKNFSAIIPAYHMNKVHWNTVILSGDVNKDDLKNLMELSFDLVGSKNKKRKV